MDNWYWISEYGKVFCGYLILLLLWPRVVFNSHLRTKSGGYRFSFCVTVSIIVMNTVVLMLGLFHGLSQWAVRLIFYGIFMLAFLKNAVAYLDRRYRRLVDAKFQDVRTLKGKYRALVLIILFFIVCGKYVKKAARFLSLDYLRKIRSCNPQRIRIRIKEFVWDFWHQISFLFWKYGILAAVIIYGMVYFSYGAFQIHSYGYGDLYTHHAWIYGLIEGDVFRDGVYPEAMHCFIYCIHSLFGIKIYSILLFLQGIHVAVFLLSVYFLLGKIFRWRYTPVFVLMLFLTLDLCNADLIHSMFRLQITMPMEFGLHTVCLSALYLKRYLEKEYIQAAGRKKKVKKYVWDENLLLFMCSLAAAAMTHFHTAMMAVLVCVSFAVFELRKILNKKYLLPLMAASFCAGMLAVVPLAGGLMQGIPFNPSIDWAVNAISGEESRDLRGQEDRTEDSGEIGRTKGTEETEKTEQILTKISGDEEMKAERMLRSEISITAAVLSGLIEFYDKGYAALYGKGRGGWMLILTAAAAGFCWLIKRRERLKCFREICSGYPPVIVASLLYILIYMAPMAGLPDLLPEGRFFAPGHMMVLAVMAMPVDILFASLIRFCNDLALRLVSLVSVLGIYGVAILTGNFRGMLFYELSRYNAAAEVTESIIERFPQHSYTIVSPTDELYPVIQYGWHEELLGFVENCSKGKYSIPSEYVFIYVEKKPLLYAQSHFFDGPRWFGEEKYLEPFWGMYSRKYEDSGASQAPEVIAGEVSKELADQELPEYGNAWLMYLKPENRTALESKAYGWCREFERRYPSVLNVYYENEEFVCYYFRQDAGKLPYELGVEVQDENT